MGKIRFMVKHRVSTIFRYIFRRRRSPARYHRLDPSPNWRVKPISTLFNWTRCLKIKAKAMYSRSLGTGKGLDLGRGYIHIGQDPVVDKPMGVPKGHITVYVGQKDGDFQRVLVPVIYFNHPLFCELLREAEEEYGYDHPGGITLPCQISEFEHVQTRIKQGRVTRKLMMAR